jgi:hypothetical protein
MQHLLREVLHFYLERGNLSLGEGSRRLAEIPQGRDFRIAGKPITATKDRIDELFDSAQHRKRL